MATGLSGAIEHDVMKARAGGEGGGEVWVVVYLCFWLLRPKLLSSGFTPRAMGPTGAFRHDIVEWGKGEVCQAKI